MKSYRNAVLLLFLICTCFFKYFSAQTQVHGTLKDANTHEALPFCSVSVKGTNKGSIANADGNFTILVDTTTGFLTFFFIGYETKTISAKSLFQTNTVYLNKTEIAMNEVVVHQNNDYLYDILSECRKKIPNYEPKNVAKVYLGLETKAKEQPIELLEIYYNGYLNGITMDNLLIKNGRVAWAAISSPTGSRYFMSLATTLALSKINLTNNSNDFAALPLQFNKGKMKKQFSLSLMSSTKEYTHIAFKPIQDSSRYFSGEMWIDKNHNLLKISLNGEKIGVYPFIPLGLDSMYDFSIHLTETFSPINGVFLPNHIDFKYHFTYKSIRDTSVVLFRSIVTNTYSTQGILYFYDYSAPFVLPHFDYDPVYDDYRKMGFIPYNSVFWDNNNKVPLTEAQKQDLGFFSEKGHLLKYNQKYYWWGVAHPYDSVSPRTTISEVYNIFWSNNHRLSIFKSIEDNEEGGITGGIPSDLYNLNVQLLLDITRVGDSLYHSSYTVFDRHRSFYHLPRYASSNCFINIYFDLCEIERRKMEAKLPTIGYNLEEMNAIYEETQKEMKDITQKYLNEVYLGKNERELQKWNDYVNDYLGIDNMKMYSEEMQQK